MELVITPSIQMHDGRAELRPPLDRGQLIPLDESVYMVQLQRPMSEKDHKVAAEWLREYPHVTLRVYSAGADKGYDFLRHYDFLKRFALVAWDQNALDRLPENITHLWLEHPRSQMTKGVPKESFASLARFRDLAELHAQGPAKEVEAIGQLTTIEKLMFRSCALPGLGPFASLKRLHTLELRLGSLASLEGIERIGKLRYLELWMIRNLADLSPIADLIDLETLFLQALKGCAVLPNLSKLRKLKRLHLETMKSITDFSPISTAPSLETLLMVDMSQATVENIAPLIGHRTLKYAKVGTGSQKRNEAITAALGIPWVPPGAGEGSQCGSGRD